MTHAALPPASARPGWPGWPDPDPAEARRRARVLAVALGARAVAERRRVLGGPLTLYRIALPTDDFTFAVRVSDRSCVLDGRHRRASPDAVPFSVSFQHPLFANSELVPGLSGRVGCSVFAPGDPPWLHNASRLLLPALRPRVRAVDWTSVHEAALFSVALHAVIRFDETDVCAAQVRALRALLEAAHAHAGEAP